MDRMSELQANLQDVEREISDACIAANRNRADVTLIAVTKTWPASDVDLLASLGITDVGENRDQEARPKRDEVQAKNLIWHAIGQLQTNKAKSVATWADVVHSVDRTDLVTALSKAVAGRQTPLKVLIQANLDPNPTENRGGALPNELLKLADLISECDGLHLQGIMGVAPLAGDDEMAFSRLQEFADQIQSAHPQADWISAGMSGDFATALKYGATHLRIGSSILGNRGFQG
jgi:pyridoxal phosphate enzyme (YggS family)